MEKIIEEYLRNAEKYSQAMDMIFEKEAKGSEKRAARKMEKVSSERCHEIFLELKAKGELFKIESFMYHQSPYVRSMTAGYCLFSNPESAEKVLEELVEHVHGASGMQALSNLKVWRNIPWTEDRYK